MTRDLDLNTVVSYAANLVEQSPQYQQMLDDYEQAFGDTADDEADGLLDLATHIDQVQGFYSEPAITDLVEEFQDVARHPMYHGAFPTAMFGEDYETAATMTDYTADELQEAFEPHVDTVRDLREQHGLDADDFASDMSADGLEQLEQAGQYLEGIFDDL